MCVLLGIGCRAHRIGSVPPGRSGARGEVGEQVRGGGAVGGEPGDCVRRGRGSTGLGGLQVEQVVAHLVERDRQECDARNAIGPGGRRGDAARELLDEVALLRGARRDQWIVAGNAPQHGADPDLGWWRVGRARARGLGCPCS